MGQRLTFGIESNTERAGHGGTLDEAYLDEAFTLVDGRLEQAFRPAMITRRNTQLGVISTAGWLGRSPYLEDKVRRGRESCGETAGTAYFEWSAPDDADADDPAVWWDCMPAMGYTVTPEAIAAERAEMTDDDFRRAYLNQWRMKPDLVVKVDAFPPGTWQRVGDHSASPSGDLAFAVEVNQARTWSTVAIAGGGVVEILPPLPGTGQVVATVVALASRWNPTAVAVDPAGPAGALLPELRDRGLPVVEVGGRAVQHACEGLYDAVVEQRVRHLDQDVLNVAADGATRRPIGDAWVWDRKHSAVDVSPLVAVSLALYAQSTTDRPAPPTEPRIRTL